MKNTEKALRFSLAPLALAAVTASLGCGGTSRAVDQYRDDTAKLLQTANDGITGCYTQVLKTNPTAQGSVTAKFVVAPETGKLRKIKIDPARSTAPAPVQECVRQYISDLVLNPPDNQAGIASFSWDFTIKMVQAPGSGAIPVAPAAPGVPPVAADAAKPPS